MVYRFFIFALITLNTFTSVHTSETKKETTAQYHWKFEDGLVPKGWTVTETNGKNKLANWDVVYNDKSKSHWLEVTETKNTKQTYNLAVFSKTYCKDLTIETTVKAISGKEDQGGGPIWRAKDKNNYYIARWNPLEDNFRVYFVKEGKRKQIASLDVKLDPTKPHTISIRMLKNRIYASINDAYRIEVEDNTFQNPGMIGLWTKADAATAFDDVKLHPIITGALE